MKELAGVRKLEKKKTGVLGLKIINWNFSASCLEHSLQTNPKDIEITKGEVIETIKKDINFKIPLSFD